MTETHFGSSTNQIAHAVSLDTNHANAFVAAGAEKCWSPFDHCGVRCTTFSSSSAKARVENTSCGRSDAASEDDARHAHQENYVDEPIVAVHQ